MTDLPPIRPYIVRPAITFHRFRLPLHRRMLDVLKGVLIFVAGH